jgi:hypothetical protein
MGKVFEFLKGKAGARKREIMIFILVFLICSLSFGLGYLTNRRFDRIPIIIEKCSGIN